MAKPVDAAERLGATDVTERAAAVRALAEGGTFPDALRLIEVALHDRSPSVRLHAAGAAAQICARVSPTADEQAQLLASVQRLDPGFNPSLLLVLAAAPDAGGIERIGRLLRDPRSDVRAGAVAALKHLVGRGHPPVEAAVRGWLLAGKHPADVVGEMVRMASEAGWTEMDELIRHAAARGRPAAIAAQEALEWSVARRDPASWVGLWVELDVAEQAVVDWLYLEGGRAWGPTGELGELLVDDGAGRLPDRPPLVRVRLGRATEDGPSEALAIEQRRLWRQTPKLIATRVDLLQPILDACAPAALGIARELAPLEGAASVRARMIALWRGGALRDADRILTSMAASERKVKPELIWIHANVKLGLGDRGGARERLVAALEAGPKKAAWRAAAEALLAEL